MATTGQFVNLPIKALKVTFGIFKQKAHKKDYLWRVLKYVPQVLALESTGKYILAESNHVESALELAYLSDNKEANLNTKVPQAQDFHTIFAVILELYNKLQNSEF